MFKCLSFYTWDLYFCSDCPKAFFAWLLLCSCALGGQSQTAELLWEKCSQTLKIKLHFYGNALDPVNGPLFGAVPFEESLLTGCLYTH